MVLVVGILERNSGKKADVCGVPAKHQMYTIPGAGLHTDQLDSRAELVASSLQIF